VNNPINAGKYAVYLGFVRISPSVGSAQNLQNIHKYVYHIHVEIEGGEYVLLGTYGEPMPAAHHELCVVNQVNGKEQGTQAGINGGDGTLAHKDGHNPEEQQDQEAAHQDATHHGEVVARLQGETSESQTNCRSDYHGQKNLFWSISARCHAQ